MRAGQPPQVSSIIAEDRPINEVWAPLDGRAFRFGIRFEL
jgi:hypothetical protein